MPTKHALLIGINKYPYMAQKYQLSGCVNDAKLMRNTLINKFNFERSNIKELHNEAASRDSILREMNALIRRIKKDDIVVFHYAGHGHRCSIKGGDGYTDEGSGKDNCILPSDDSKPTRNLKKFPKGKEYREIRDEQFNEWLTRLAAKTRYITLIFDACHSATMTRSSGEGSRSRSVPESARPGQRAAPKSSKKTAVRKKGPGGWLNLSNNYVVISGCRDMQTSKEKFFHENGRKYKHGVLTYNLINAMTRAKPGTTYRDVFELACAGVAARVSGQNPQIEGRLDRELFGVKDIEPLRFIPVEKVSGNTVTLSGGAAQGLRVGSRWTAYPQGTKQTEGSTKQGVLQVTNVGPLSSTATVISSSSPVKVGSRCIETQAVIEPSQLSVGLHALSASQQAVLKTRIQNSKLLTLASSAADADVSASVLPSGTKSPVTSKNLTEATWAFHEDDNTLAMPLHALSERGVAKLLVSNLETIARFRRTIALDNPVTNLNVEFNLYKRGANDKLKLANGGSTEFTEDDPMVLEVCNKEASRSIFISILWMSANKEIGHFYPPRKSSEEIQAGKTIRIGHGKRKLRARLAKNHPGDFGLETCKIFVTTEASDFTWLNQQGTRSAAKKLKPLESAIRGNTSKPVNKAKANGPDWDAINRSFILKRTPAGKAKTKK